MNFFSPSLIRRQSYDGRRPQRSRSEHHVYIRILGVDPGNFPLDNSSILTLCIGPRKAYLNHQYDFTANAKIDNTWEFIYKNSLKSSLTIGLFSKSFFGTLTEIGEIELNLAAFKVNAVTKQTFTLRSKDRNLIPPKIKVTIHLSENGETSFHAPETNKIKDEFEIIRKPTLGPRSL